MKIAITGSTGFLGRHLVNILSKENLLIIGRRPIALSTVQFYKASIDGKTNYCKALINTDVLIHCAARVHIMNDVAADPLAEFREVNTYGTLNLAKQAAVSGVKRFIYISSIKVNGETTKDGSLFGPHDTPSPKDSYGISKTEAEQQLFIVAKKTGMEIVIIRPPLVYGEGVKANFASLMNIVGKGVPLPFRAIKQNKRSLLSVYNLVDLIITCIDHPNAANEIFLVSDDVTISTSDLIKKLFIANGKRPLLFPVPIPFLTILATFVGKKTLIEKLTVNLTVDIEHTKRLLDWSPPITLDEGIRRCFK